MFGARHIYCPLKSLVTALPRIQELGLGVEVLLDETSDLWPTARWENLLDVADAIAESGVDTTVHGPFQGMSLGALDGHIRDYSLEVLCRGLEVARCFRSPLMVFHTGYLPQYPPKTRARWMANFSSNLEILLQRASDLDVLPVLENTYETDPDLLQEIFDRFPGPDLGMCLDTGHATCYGKVDPTVWSRQFVDRICHIHCSDNDGKQDLHWDLGTGVVNFPAILAPLAALENTSSVTFETALDSAEVSRDYFLNLLHTVRQ